MHLRPETNLLRRSGRMSNRWNFPTKGFKKRVPISVLIVSIPSFLTVSHISEWGDGARQTEIFSCLENINSPGTFPDFLLSSFLLHYLSERGEIISPKIACKCKKKPQTVSSRRHCRRVFSAQFRAASGTLRRLTAERRGRAALVHPESHLSFVLFVEVAALLRQFILKGNSVSA